MKAMIITAITLLAGSAFAGGHSCNLPTIQFGNTFVSADNVCVNANGDFQTVASVCVMSSAQLGCLALESQTLTASRKYTACVNSDRAGNCTETAELLMPLTYTVNQVHPADQARGNTTVVSSHTHTIGACK